MAYLAAKAIEGGAKPMIRNGCTFKERRCEVELGSPEELTKKGRLTIIMNIMNTFSLLY